MKTYECPQMDPKKFPKTGNVGRLVEEINTLHGELRRLLARVSELERNQRHGKK